MGYPYCTLSEFLTHRICEQNQMVFYASMFWGLFVMQQYMTRTPD